MSDVANPPSLPARVADAIERRDLLHGIERLVVACSGGSDSVALVEILGGLAASRPLHLSVAHLDHGLRDAGADRARVERLARDHGLRLLTERLPEGAAGGSEASWRRARLRFLRRAVDETGADAVALGHTLDDQVETLLLHLARGAGRRGLGGMRWRARLDGLTVIRPLLGTRRQELRDLLTASAIDWVDDPTNAQMRFARNRVRAMVVPALEEALPGASDRLARASELLAEEEAWLAALTADALERLRVAESFAGGVALCARGLRDQPAPLAARVVRAAVREVRGSLRGIELRHVQEIVAMVVAGARAARDLPGVRARLEGTTLRLLPLRDRRLAGPETS